MPDEFKILMFAESHHWERVRRVVPSADPFRVEIKALDSLGESGISGEDVVVLFMEKDRFGAAFPWLKSVDPTDSQKIALVADNIQVNETVRLIRAGFDEVFDAGDELELLSEWIVHHYEEKIKQPRLPRNYDKSDRNLTKIIGTSDGIQNVKKLAKQAGLFSDMTVLIQGETGTGKEMVARYIHEHSSRDQSPFVEVNCSAIPESLMESEMLGHEKGAFTDARQSKKGFFELAHGGTLFLDEIGVMSGNLQNKILKIVEEKMFRRVGGEKTITVDVKVIAGTNTNLLDAVSQGRFRPDLFYRLNVFAIHILPLRERTDDIAILAEYFLSEIKRRYHLQINGFHPSTMSLLCSHDWPGNVRELKHIVERSAVVAGQGRILPTHLPDQISKSFPEEQIRNLVETPDDSCLRIPLPDDGIAMDDIERIVIRDVLDRFDGNQSQAARFLKISRTRLIRKLPGRGSDESAGRSV